MSSNSRKRPRSKKQGADIDNVISSIGRLTQAEPDAHDNYAKNVASKLRGLPKDQRIFCENFFNEAMMDAELGNLSRESHVSLRAPLQQQYYQEYQDFPSHPHHHPVPSNSNAHRNNIGSYYVEHFKQKHKTKTYSTIKISPFCCNK